jgi:mannose-1-phosphate guanylyltransferase
MGETKGLVLCGGLGTRLRPITYYFQKTMIPIGPKQKPILEYVVQLFKFNGITNLAFLVNHKAEQIINYFADGSRFDVKIAYIRDDSMYMGTAGSILNSYRQDVVNTDDTLLIYYGDIITNMNLKDLLSHHKGKNSSATIVLSSSFKVAVGVADVDKDGRIQSFVEKPELKKPVSVGILVLDGEVLEVMEELKKKARKLDLMGDVIPHLIKIAKPVHSYLTNAFWYDVGSTEAYEKLDPKVVEDRLSYLF